MSFVDNSLLSPPPKKNIHVQHSRNRVHRNLVAFSVRLLHRRVVGVLVRNEERGFDVAPVRVPALAVEYLLVEFDVVVVDGIVKCNRDHLWHFFGRQIVGYTGTVLGTETVRKNAHGRVAGWCPVRIVVAVCNGQKRQTRFNEALSLRLRLLDRLFSLILNIKTV